MELFQRHDQRLPALTTLDGNTIRSQRAQSYTQFVPLDDPDRALSLLPIGQSERPGSPSRTSAMEMWRRGELHPAPLSREAVDRFSSSVEVLTPRPITAVAEEGSESEPGTFALQQNFPNPFNSNTVITYTVPKAGTVRLSIYAASGQLVWESNIEHVRGGTYRAAWNGTDGEGRDLASGVYLYRLKSGSHVAERKLSLLR